jgi:8-amino-7-oxononanoate synthase
MRRSATELTTALARLDREHLRRRLRVVDPTSVGAVDFCSNDYLGLRRHPALVEAAVTATERYGTGSGASHLVTGHGPEHAALEEELAAFTGRERALVFSTGYMANLGVVAALADRRDWIVEDKLNHASLLDAAKLAGGELQRYAHGDARAAADLLAAAGDRNALIVTDGVFSMDGDIAPLAALAQHARQRAAWLIVDDAHGLGVLGARGGGCLEADGLDQEAVPVLIGTFGKAFGSFGAFIAGSEPLIDYIVQKARTYIYTTALPPGVAAATRAALRVSQDEAWRRTRVLALVERFRARALASGVSLAASSTPIQPVLLGSSERALATSAALEARGFLVAAIRPPTVAKNAARLRVTLSATHAESQVDSLVDALAELCRDA